MLATRLKNDELLYGNLEEPSATVQPQRLGNWVPLEELETHTQLAS